LTIGTDVIRWIFQLLLTLLAARLMLLATRRARSAPSQRDGTQSFHPGSGGSREKSPRLESLTTHPIDDADYEEIPRSSV
jgi:hypothetical protein